MRLSVKFNADELRLLERLTRKLQLTRAEVLKTGLRVLAARDLTTYERVSHLLGCVRGPAHLSERSGSRFRQQLLLP